MIEIVGIGPFVVSSLVIRAMGGAGAHRVAGGALLATLDAFVWSELARRCRKRAHIRFFA